MTGLHVEFFLNNLGNESVGFKEKNNNCFFVKSYFIISGKE